MSNSHETDFVHARFRFSFLQCFATPPVVLVVLSVASFFQGLIVNGLVYASITTLETRFNLLSSESGLIASCYDIASCTSLLLITYIGGRGHKPLWLGWGIILMGVGSIVFSLPRFVAPYHLVSFHEDTCNGTLPQNLTQCYHTSIRNYRHIFCFAQLVVGFGSTPLYSLGVTYLDENVEQVESALYHGIYYAMSAVGPGMGFFMAGTFLQYYTVLGENVLPSNSQFIGAWWLPFLLFGSLSVLVGIPMLLFPKQMPGTEELRQGRDKEMQTDSVAIEIKKDQEFGKRLVDFPKCLSVLLRNRVYLFLTLGGSADAMLIAGLTTFGSKILESLFKLSSSYAAVLLGTIAILGGAGGNFIGGIMVWSLNMVVSDMIKLSVVGSVFTLAFAIIFAMSCVNASFAGVTVPYPFTTSIGGIISQCNINCNCYLDFFNPVCGSDGSTYYSPCLAACTSAIDDTKYGNCSCLSNSTSLSQTVTAGSCPGEVCSNGGHITYTIFVFLFLFVTFVIAMPVLQATIRIVPFTQRAFAVGIQWIILRLFNIAGPVVFGFVLDNCCLLWNTSCGERGACIVHDNSSISFNLLILVMILNVLGVFFYSLAYIIYKPALFDNSTEYTTGSVEASSDYSSHYPPSWSELSSPDSPESNSASSLERGNTAD